MAPVLAQVHEVVLLVFFSMAANSLFPPSRNISHWATVGAGFDFVWKTPGVPAFSEQLPFFLFPPPAFLPSSSLLEAAEALRGKASIFPCCRPESPLSLAPVLCLLLDFCSFSRSFRPVFIFPPPSILPRGSRRASPFFLIGSCS